VNEDGGNGDSSQIRPAFTTDIHSGNLERDQIDSQYVKSSIVGNNGESYEVAEFDPSSTAGKKWLKKMANKQVTTGTKCHHISNNVPRNICDFDAAKLKVGVEVAKKMARRRSRSVRGVF
jgi:hypothetical protein